MDTFSTKHLSRQQLQSIMDLLGRKDFEYTLDHRKETITFDMTEFDQTNQGRLRDILGDPIYESKLKSQLRPIVTEILREIRNKKK